MSPFFLPPFRFLGELLNKLLTPPFYLQNLGEISLTHLKRTTPPLVGVMGMLGVVIALQARSLSALARGDLFYGALIGIVILREVAPVVTAVLLAAQAGTYTTTELGAMRLKEEFSALELIAVDPFRFAVVPRFLAFLFVSPLLILFASASGIVGGAIFILSLLDIQPDTLTGSLYGVLSLSDLMVAILKGFIFGGLVGFFSCFYGYLAEETPEAVGKAAHRAIVLSIILILSCNYLLSSLFFGETGMRYF
jgi:phospholipid/cholesterol/gamma-HCH transport system permease protein